MKFKETDLPGIGKKFSVITANKEKISVIIHLSGKRELYFFSKDDFDEPMCSFVLSDEEANQLGSVLMGTYFKPEGEEEKELFMRNLVIEWINVDGSSPLANKSIKDLQIRKRTGVTVVSIIRGSHTITNPMPEEVIKEGDTIIIIGNKEQTEKFFQIFYSSCEIK